MFGLDTAAETHKKVGNLVGVVAKTAQDAAQVALQAANLVPTDSGSVKFSNKESAASSVPFDEKNSGLDCRNDTTSSTNSSTTTPPRTPGTPGRREHDANTGNDTSTSTTTTTTVVEGTPNAPPRTPGRRQWDRNDFIDEAEGIARKAVALVTPSPPKKSVALPPIMVMPTDHLDSSIGGGQAAEVRLASMQSVVAAKESATSTPQHEARQYKMTLKLLRGIDFPTIEEIPQEYSTRLLIQLSVLRRLTTKNEGLTNEDDEDIVETIEITDRSTQIWGGPTYTYGLECNDEDEIMLSLIKEDRNTGVSRMIGRTTRQVAFLLSHLRPRLNPNRWVELSPTDTSLMKSIESFGKIQARLSLKTTAVIHEQENCEKISAGPALITNNPTNLTSYVIRKQALWSTTPVMLNVYDVSLDPRVQNANGYIKAVGAGGIFHAAVEIYGREWSFGGTRNKRSCVTGIFSSVPKQCPMHQYRETIYLGDCHLTHREVFGIVSDLKPEWLANSYNLFRRNCCFFSQELAVQLGVGDIPEWVHSLATSAEFIEPYLQKLNKYLTDRARAAKNDKVKKGNTTNKATKDAVPPKVATSAKVKVETRQTTSHDKAGVEEIEVEAGEEFKMETGDEKKLLEEQAKGSQPPAHVEVMMDHAMAAKIQRSFRRSQNVVGNHRGGPRKC